MHVTFERRVELAPAIWEYYFRPERPVDYVAGQYVELRLPQLEGDPRGPGRTFTLTSLPVDPEISFVTKHFELQTPYKDALLRLQPGGEARIDDAMGDLVLPKTAGTPLIFVAGGIGAASYVSMIKHLTARREERPIYLFYWLRSRREQLFRDIFDAYPLSLKQVVLAPNQLSAREITAATPPDSFIYLSGSQNFVETLRAEFETLGTPRSRIVFDYYDGYAEL